MCLSVAVQKIQISHLLATFLTCIFLPFHDIKRGFKLSPMSMLEKIRYLVYMPNYTNMVPGDINILLWLLKMMSLGVNAVVTL